MANLALSALTAGAGNSPLRTCVASLPPRSTLGGCTSIFPIHSTARQLFLLKISVFGFQTFFNPSFPTIPRLVKSYAYIIVAKWY